ncbi:MAG TPA: methyltransferase domain-containing protein [Solirubrobacteraceae bacterium]|nr:methyltransferase domain-containing protein [Solirubrobacteraceae bacterium]
MAAGTFDPDKFKATTREQWQEAAAAWDRWGPTLESWLGPATEAMLDGAGVQPGARVLDVAAGAGGQTLTAARRVGPGGHVLATDISPVILEYAADAARDAGLANVEIRELDGESLAGVEDASFDAVISRVGLIYFPDQQGALAEIRRVLRPGGRVAAVVYSTPENNRFFSTPVGIIRRRAELGPPLPGQPGPFSLGGEGALADAYEQAGFHDVQVQVVPSPLRMSSAVECLRFERESFGALHQMLAGLDEAGRELAWQEVGEALGEFDSADGFTGPCELLVGAATR